MGGVNGAIYYLAPIIPDPGLRGFAVVFLELLTVWASTEEEETTKTVVTKTTTTGVETP